MSDLYLDLKHRIPVVTNWTSVPTEEMQRAQDRLGLSDERLARLIPISAKTWVRWKRRGAIPTHLLPKVAPILGFEIIPVEPVTVLAQEGPAALVPGDVRESLSVLVDLARTLNETARRCEQSLGRIEQATLARDVSRARASRP